MKQLSVKQQTPKYTS